MNKHRNKPLVSSILSMLALSLTLFSQLTHAATATVSSNKLAKSEVFQLKIVASENLDAEDVDFSVLEEDFFIGKPRFGFYTNITNGKKTVKSEWALALAPLRAGILTIPSFKVGNSLTQPISITVTVDPAATTQEDLVEVQVQLDKKELYPGELNTLDTRIILKADSRQIQSANILPPSVQGADTDAFSMEPIGEQKQYQAALDGMEVIVVDQSYKLTANHSGKFVINGPAFKGAILDSSRRSGGSRVIPINTKPELLVVTVLDKPKSYQGNWLPSSALTLTQKWLDESGNEIDVDSVNLTVGSPITRQIELRAKGISSEQLPNLKVNYPGSIRVYEDSPQITQEDGTAILKLNQVLIARSAGDIDLPDVALSWWNTTEKKEARSKISGIQLVVEQGEDANVSVTPAVPHTKLPEPQVITETKIVKDTGYWPYVTALFALLWLVTFILYIRARTQSRDTSTEPEQKGEDNTTRALVQAIQSRDGFKANALLNQWIAERSRLAPELQTSIKTEAELMQQSLFGAQSSDWSDQKLLKLIKKAEKLTVRSEVRETLASL
ncbi:BatD family protein [Vibrio sp. HN007]|uniref:BatD family protein n=1 Tax=Vibrio iocasae TaxID=3098914 RepID=UPI0035D4D2BF